jgi:GxxExxY protein
MNEALDNELTYRIIGLAIQVHRHLGPGLLEKVYRTCLCQELAQADIPFESQMPLPVRYRGAILDCGYIADIIVYKRVILELKSVERALPLHEAQLLTYLRLAGCRIGLLINFNSAVLTDGVTRKVL